ncbi:MAG: copper-binding protein [Variovorax sp.]
MNTFRFFTACASLAVAAASFAQAALPAVEARGRKVDLDNRKITLTHGDIPNIDMDAMTMVFAVKDPKMLEHVKAGDKVRFTADKVGGALTVMSIEVDGP